eukprot:15363531-Ditylum_brightwellii.AAC.1
MMKRECDVNHAVDAMLHKYSTETAPINQDVICVVSDTDTRTDRNGNMIRDDGVSCVVVMLSLSFLAEGTRRIHSMQHNT